MNQHMNQHMSQHIIWARTTHKRFMPTQHRFSYDVPYVLTPIDELDRFPSPIFSRNKRNLYAIYDGDYLTIGPESINEKLKKLRKQWEQSEPSKTWLLTLPRFFNRVFNPVSFYLEVDATHTIQSAIAEVTNTYGEKHIYFIKGNSNPKYLDCRLDKVLHVSPFLNEHGHYQFRIGRSLQHIDIHIRYIEKNKTVLYANLIQKETMTMSTTTLIKTAIRYPLGILGTLPRIMKEAIKLHYIKKIPAKAKPVPNHPHTIRPMPPTRIDNWCMQGILKQLRQFEIGKLTLILPNGHIETIGQTDDFHATLHIREYRFFRLLLKGEIGFGETYVNGIWDTHDLVSLLSIFIRNNHHLKSAMNGSVLSKLASRLHHALKKNTLANSRHNIRAHYDISNELYALFLDQDMHYSSAYFKKSSDSLEQAQKNKLDYLYQQLRVKAEHHVLEIGSGWGGAAIRLAKQTGCRITTLTLSQAQYTYVQERIKQEKLEDQITVLLEDYRHHKKHPQEHHQEDHQEHPQGQHHGQHQEKYDRILSIEMIEAVGYDYLPTYFKTIENNLKPNGIAVIQAITIPDQRYDEYRQRMDWIQAYIFPGGHLPSLHHIQSILANHTHLMIDNIQNIGPHYATTLTQWRNRFLKNESQIRDMGFDTDFIRKWTYYLAYCEAGFQNRYINTLQMTLTRPINDDLIREDSIWQNSIRETSIEENSIGKNSIREDSNAF